MVLGTNGLYSFGFFQNVTIWTNETKWNVLWINVSHFNSMINPMQSKNTTSWTKKSLLTTWNLHWNVMPLFESTPPTRTCALVTYIPLLDVKHICLMWMFY
jgi:hypothetical protein